MSTLVRMVKDITTHLVALRREIESGAEEMTIEQVCLLRDVCKALGLDETFTMIVLGERNYHLVGWPENVTAEMANEWKMLYQNGIVPQKPPKNA